MFGRILKLIVIVLMCLIIESESNEKMRVVHHSTPNRDRRNEERHLSDSRDSRDVQSDNTILQRILDKLDAVLAIDQQKFNRRFESLEQRQVCL